LFKNLFGNAICLYLVILAIVASFGAGLVVGEETVRKNYLASADQQKFGKTQFGYRV